MKALISQGARVLLASHLVRLFVQLAQQLVLRRASAPCRSCIMHPAIAPWPARCVPARPSVAVLQPRRSAEGQERQGTVSS